MQTKVDINRMVQQTKSYQGFDFIVLNITLFLYPFEFFDAIHHGALGPISPFRVVILPLCLIYIIKNIGRTTHKNNIIDVAAILFFFLSACLSCFISGSLSSLFSLVGNAVQLVTAFMLFRRIGLGNRTLFILTTWTIIQFPALIISIASREIGMTFRFHGWFFDPNYLCSFVLGSICASFFVFQDTQKKWLKYYCLSIITIGLIMMFLSFSRGGLLALFSVVVIILFCNHKKILLTISILLVPVISALIIRAQYITWADAANNMIDAVLYRTITVSQDVGELTAGRSDFIETFIKNIDDFLFVGTDLEHYIESYNQGAFPHNGFLELLIQGGVLFGGFFVIRLLTSITKEVLMTSKYKKVPCELIVGLGILIPLTFLSYTSKIAWLCIGLLFALSQKQIFRAHL